MTLQFVLLLGFFVAFCSGKTSSGVTASAATTATASVFMSKNDGFAFSLNVPTSSDDLYFSLSGPEDRSWISVGLGSQKMENSFMITAYGSSNRQNITISPRLSYGHQEPVWTSNSTIEVLAGSGFSNGSIIANGRCINCRRWQGGALDVTSTAQSMIFAMGPTGKIHSDSLTAGTKAHTDYGVFTMDMRQAGGAEGIPTTSDSSSSGTVQLSTSTYTDILPPLHAAFMIFAFVGLMPFGIVILRIIGSVRWHAINQFVAALLSTLGAAIGIYIGLMYNRSKSFNSAHQIMGLIVCAAVILQFVLGYLNHRTYKKTQTTTKIAPIHVWLGRLIIPVAVAAGFLGFPLALSPNYNWIIAGLVIGVAVILLVAFIFNRRKAIRSADNTALHFPDSALNRSCGYTGELNHSDASTLEMHPYDADQSYESLVHRNSVFAADRQHLPR